MTLRAGLWISAIRWRIPASGCGWPLFRKTLAGIRVSQRKPEASWKGFLPASEVHVPQQLEGNPSSWQGKCTSPVNWKEILPANEVHVPQRLEGYPSSLLAGPLKGGYPWIPAAADGYPLAGADADADGHLAGKSSRISASVATSSNDT
ncbi:hypothetical protein PGT21_033230 [Puccinia graminis f. sp. tritici]|uniref:Uncharacterized protein n=1 Tax=Puccinia graminis f. sp. tritici TaxID=56615 RepID=A0A5B0MH15_PUCGR|nr:hypothetical protein PGT21_033230 [Puccinia graminis f. sp. tritici]